MLDRTVCEAILLSITTLYAFVSGIKTTPSNLDVCSRLKYHNHHIYSRRHDTQIQDHCSFPRNLRLQTVNSVENDAMKKISSENSEFSRFCRTRNHNWLSSQESQLSCMRTPNTQTSLRLGAG